MTSAVGGLDSLPHASQKKAHYEKPALREIAPAAHPAAVKDLQDFLAQMKALGQEPSQAAFETYLAGRGGAR